MPAIQKPRVVYDVDGTLCEYAYPDFGSPRWDVIETVWEFKRAGFEIWVSSSRTSPLANPDPAERERHFGMILAFLEEIGFPVDYVDDGTLGKIPGFKIDDECVSAFRAEDILSALGTMMD